MSKISTANVYICKHSKYSPLMLSNTTIMLSKIVRTIQMKIIIAYNLKEMPLWWGFVNKLRIFGRIERIWLWKQASKKTLFPKMSLFDKINSTQNKRANGNAEFEYSNLKKGFLIHSSSHWVVLRKRRQSLCISLLA